VATPAWRRRHGATLRSRVTRSAHVKTRTAATQRGNAQAGGRQDGIMGKSNNAAAGGRARHGADINASAARRGDIYALAAYRMAGITPTTPAFAAVRQRVAGAARR